MKNPVKARELLQLIDKKDFNELCQKWEMDKGVRKFGTRDHVSCLLAAFLLKLDSLREIEQVLEVPRSTLSDANCNRCSGFYDELSELVLKSIKLHTKNRKVKGAIKNLFSIDASVCGVHGSLASTWLWKAKSSHSNKSAVSLHAVLNVNEEVIEDFRIAPVKLMETTIARQLEIKSGVTYVFDRAYRQLIFWWTIMDQGSHFITRLVSSKARRKERNIVLKKNKGKDGVLYDGKYVPGASAFYENPEVPKDIKLRKVIYRDPVSKKVFDFVTSNTEISGQEIADIYKKRWSVELLFRWLKGHLGIRYIPSRNKNSVKVQFSIAILLQLLIRLAMLKNNYKGTSWEYLRSIRTEILKNAAHKVFGRRRGLSPPSKVDLSRSGFCF